MAQPIVSWFISNGRFRVQAINAVGRRKGRIIEVEEVDSRETQLPAGVLPSLVMQSSSSPTMTVGTA
jgi:hypothetical protein